MCIRDSNAVTPLLVPEEQLTKCAGYSQSLQSISSVSYTHLDVYKRQLYDFSEKSILFMASHKFDLYVL